MRALIITTLATLSALVLRVDATLLHVAAEQNDITLVKKLIDEGHSPDHVHNETGLSALSAAAIHGSSEAIEALIAAGADVHAVDEQRMTVLHDAAYYNRASAIKMLLAHGAKVDAVDLSGSTPLHRAAFHGGTDAIKALVAGGAAVDAARGDDGHTPVHLAAQNGFEAAIHALVDAGADLEKKTAKGLHAAEVAAFAGEQAALNVINEHRINIRAKMEL